jgi:hypothetical protein
MGIPAQCAKPHPPTVMFPSPKPVLAHNSPISVPDFQKNIPFEI